MDDSVGHEAQYEPYAEEFLEHAKNGLYNAHYDRPACLSLLGDVKDKTVLDAACGPGLYAEELVTRGAKVVGFDVSERMVDLATRRVPFGEFRVHDLSEPLDWLGPRRFDYALLALALEYVDDRVRALENLRRVLHSDGALVLSVQHPTATWLRLGGSYFDSRVVDEVWSRGWHLRYWYTSLDVLASELHDAGFLIERLIEPRPMPEGRDADAEDYERLLSSPGFMAIRAVINPRR